MKTLVAELRRLGPRRSDYDGLGSSWRSDLVAGATVGVVALPLALAFGITAGLGAEAGLVTAIVAGVVAAILGGSRVQVSGPTGAMTVVLVPVVARHGAEAVLVVGLLAGALVTIAAFARLGRYLAYVPWPVVEGFTLGIAVIIFLQQVPAALGVDRPHGENAAMVAGRAVIDAVDHGQLAAIALVALVACVMVLLPRLHRSMPASLLAVALATVVAEVVHLDLVRVGAIPSVLPSPSIPAISLDGIGSLVPAAVAVAALAALESLLSARVADGMSDGPRHDPDRELFGQGLANIASSVWGGMPATGAIARTAVNVRAGARTRLAAGIHSVVLVFVVLWASGLVARIPLAALAGVLVVTAARMVEVHNVRSIIRATRSDALVLTATAAATIAFDLIVAVEIGMAIAALLALRQIARVSTATLEPFPAEVEPNDAIALLDDHIVTYRLDGALFFGASQRFLTQLSTVSDVRVVVLRLPSLQVIDATGAQALGEIVASLEDRGITVLLKGVRPEHRRVLAAVGALDRLAHANHEFDTLDAALEHARRHVERSVVEAAASTT